MGLEMNGFVDLVFKSVPATRTTTDAGAYVDGVWVAGMQVTSEFLANIQPLNDRELNFLAMGGERVTDARKIYINDGPLEGVDETGEWNFLGQRWKAVRVDNRFWRSYCKIIVTRIDSQ